MLHFFSFGTMPPSVKRIK